MDYEAATYYADRLNDAWAVIRCVPHAEGDNALQRHNRDPTIAGLADDLLSLAAEIRPPENSGTKP